MRSRTAIAQWLILWALALTATAQLAGGLTWRLVAVMAAVLVAPWTWRTLEELR
jgi:hypothetical protein